MRRPLLMVTAAFLGLWLVASLQAQTIVDLPGGVTFPADIQYDQGTPAFGSGAGSLDISLEAAEGIQQAPRTGSVIGLTWCTNTVTTGATMDVRLETVSLTTGDATGTLFGANTNGAQVVADANDNVCFTTALTAAAAVTAGDLIAGVVQQPTASFGNMQIRFMGTNSGGKSQLPYGGVGVPPSYTKGVSTGAMLVGLQYSGDVYYPTAGQHPPSAAITATTLNTGTTPDVVGLGFQFPYTTRVAGAVVYADCDGDTNIRLVTTAYHQANATGIVDNFVIDPNVRQTNAVGRYDVTWPTRPTLTANTSYRAVVEPTSASSCVVYDFSVPSLPVMNMWAGSNVYFTTAKDPTVDGSWTNHNSGTFRIPYMYLLVDGISTGSSGGSFPFIGLLSPFTPFSLASVFVQGGR